MHAMRSKNPFFLFFLFFSLSWIGLIYAENGRMCASERESEKKRDRVMNI